MQLVGMMFVLKQFTEIEQALTVYHYVAVSVNKNFNSH
jgi:hypothetical protein